MKQIQVILVTVLLSLPAVLFAQEGKQTIFIKTNIHCDHCQKCESCGPRIYSHLIDIPGVRKVRVDDESSTVEVIYMADKVQPEALRTAINDAGFDADDQLAPAASVAKLDQCCKKE